LAFVGADIQNFGDAEMFERGDNPAVKRMQAVNPVQLVSGVV